MGPRAKKVRSVKTKESSSSTVSELENIGKVEEEATETNGSNEQDSKAVVDHGEEEQPPLKKGRGRQKKSEPVQKPVKDTAEDDVNGQSETKESTNETALPVKKARGRKKKSVDDDEELEVIPKRKDRSAKKMEVLEEDVHAEDDAVEEPAVEEEPKPEKAKREKKAPVKKSGKKKKDQDEDTKLTEEEESVEEAEKKPANDEPSKGKDTDADEKSTDMDGGGDGKATKKSAVKGKSTAKAAEEAPPAKKKPAARGKKQASKTEDLAGDDVEVDGKRLRVNVEHCKS